MTTKVPYEDVQAAATDIAQCAMNALTVSDLSEQSGVISMLQGVNGALQQRFVTLDLDTTRANQLPDDYDTDVESAWANPSEIVTVHNDCHFSSCSDLFADGDDFSWETIQKGRNEYYQRQLANQIEITTTRTLSLLTNALKIHLNVGQNMTINTSSIFMSLERLTIPALSRKTVYQPESGRIQLPLDDPRRLEQLHLDLAAGSFLFFSPSLSDVRWRLCSRCCNQWLPRGSLDL